MQNTDTDTRDELTLKWGTLKAWHFRSEGARAAAARYSDAGKVSASAMMQHDTPAQTDALCDLIDALNADTVYLDWEGKDVSKEEAKQCVRSYGKPAA